MHGLGSHSHAASQEDQRKEQEMIDAFWDREQELAFLEDQYRQPGSNLVVIYGRRRVGKTTTIARFSADKPSILYVADRAMETTLMGRLLAAVARHLDDDLLAQVTPPDWDWVFGQLTTRADFSRKIVLLIDEFQALAQVNDAFPSILQRLWDSTLRSRNLMLILCGSLVGMMYRTTLAYDSPLYGRRTGQLRMRPLTFAALRQTFSHRPFNDIVELYAVSGGVPVYVEALVDQVAGRRDLFDRIAEVVLNAGGRLYDEPRFVLSGEISDTTTFFSILQVIAAGSRRQTQIAGKLGLSTNYLSTYLRMLLDLEVLEKRVPITADPRRSRRSLYYIGDHFFDFWFRYVYPYQSELESGRPSIARNQIQATFDQHVSRIYEDCIRDWLWHLQDQGQLPFELQRLGSWWNKRTEIDLVGLNQTTHDIVFGECKWSQSPVGLDVLKRLYNKAHQVAWQRGERREWFVLASRSGFQEALIERARRPGIDGRRDVLLIHDGKLIG
jgi:AAA+ ATPase superfamily predicted ATPase